MKRPPTHSPTHSRPRTYQSLNPLDFSRRLKLALAVLGLGATLFVAGTVIADDTDSTETPATQPAQNVADNDTDRPCKIDRDRQRPRDRFMHRPPRGERGPGQRGHAMPGRPGLGGPDGMRPGAPGRGGPGSDRPGFGGPDGMRGPEGMERDAPGRGGPGGDGPGSMRDRMMRELFRDVNLTEQQHEQVREIGRAAAQPMQQFMADNAMAIREAREAMNAARQERDRDAMKAAREKLSALMESSPRPDREALHAQVRELLTEQQRQVFDANLEQVKQRREQMKQRRDEMRQERGQRGEGQGERRQPRRPRNAPEAPDAPQADGEQLDL